MDLLQPRPIIVTIGEFGVSSHGFLFACGAIIAALWLMPRARGYGWSASGLLEKILLVFLVGLLGARLTYLVVYPDVWTRFWQLISIWEGGLVSFGGIVAGALAVYVLGKKLTQEQRSNWFADASRATLLAWSVGRLGNYFAAESGGVHGIPIQLFESVGCLALFFLLKKTASRLVPWYAACGYLVIRFCVDFWRDESIWLGLRVSQWVAALLLVAVLTAYKVTHQDVE